MIRRRVGDEFWLIPQTIHAHLAAQLAAEIGNDRFACPQPSGPVLQGVAMHDAGWPAHDDAPTINAQGEPTDVFEMPLELSIPIWSISTQLATAADPYAGLLVSLHGLALALRSTKPDPRPPAHSFALIKFQQQEVEAQENLRRSLQMRTDQPLYHGLAKPGRAPEEDLLLFNYRLLDFADQFSLNLCFDESRFAAINGVFPRPGQEPMTLHVSRVKSGHFSITPWPFATASLKFEIAAKRVAARTYRNHDDLRAALCAAKEETLSVNLLAQPH